MCQDFIIISKQGNSSGGFLYAFDLAGGGTGGVVTGLYLIPCAGVPLTFMWLGILAGIGAAALMLFSYQEK